MNMKSEAVLGLEIHWVQQALILACKIILTGLS